jgi:hypothetical protein
LSRLKPIHIAMIAVGLIALGALAWGVGWVGHSLLDQGARPAPAARTQPTPRPSPTPVPTTPVPDAEATAGASPAPSRPRPTASPTLGGPLPTSTSAPTIAATPTVAYETIRTNDNLYEVCRRHCPGRWPSNSVPPDLDHYARRTADLNGLPWYWPGPTLHAGQELAMPPCP